MEKSNDRNDYLEDLIFKSRNLVENGINIHGKTVPVFIHTIVCDAPAKSFI